MCMYLHVCGCMYVHVWGYMLCIYSMSVLNCMYLPVFFAGKIASRTICTTYRRYTHIHTNTTKIQQTYIHIHTKIHANTCKNTYIKQVLKKCICCLLSAIFACICMYVCYMCATCEAHKSIHIACIACMCTHVYTCYYICKFWNQSICACIVCIGIHMYTCVYMYTYVGHIQATYTRLCVGAHNSKTSPGGAGNQRAPLRTAMGSSPATLSRDQGPTPRPILAHLCALHASGGGKSSPPVQPMGPPRAMGTRRARPEPRPELI
jgi:hypothetical protein